MTENDDRKGPRKVSHEELYHQVWQTPRSRLALAYGISGNGLVKICDRLNAPYPKRGYCARKTAGQRVITFRLPPPASILLWRYAADALLESPTI